MNGAVARPTRTDRRPRAATARRRGGLTFLEVLVALAILGIAIVAILPSFLSYLKVNGSSEIRTQAAAVAQQYFERYRLMDPSTMPKSGTQSASTDLAGRTFEVETTYCAQAAYCGAGSRDILVTVSHLGSEVFRAETVYTQVNVETK